MNLDFKTLTIPAGSISGIAPRAISLLLVLSATLIYTAPLAMPENYSITVHSISESAAQGLQHAWIARMGFLLFGLGVLWLSLTRRQVWPRGAYWMQLVFALSMLGTAAFSHKPWIKDIPVDSVEDLLHSITATVMGFAFSLAVLLHIFTRVNASYRVRVIDGIALAAATLISPVAVLVPDMAGILQRLMFAIAYAWYIYEAFAPNHVTQILHPS